LKSGKQNKLYIICFLDNYFASLFRFVKRRFLDNTNSQYSQPLKSYTDFQDYKSSPIMEADAQLFIYFIFKTEDRTL